MKSLSRLEQLEVMALHQPNSIEINQALAEECAKEERWEEAIEAYQTVIALYPAIAALNVNRIRLGAIALGISSMLFLIGEIVRPSIIMTESSIDAAEYMGSAALASSNILFLPILILLSCAAISIYKLLSTSNNNRLAFWAMVSTIVGAGLFLPIFAIQAVVMPAVAQLYIKAGTAFGVNVYDAALSQPLATVFKMGGYLLFVGLTLFNIAVWNSGYLPKWASTLLWIGWLLFIIVTQGLIFMFMEEIYWLFNPMLIALLIAIGGIGLAFGMWQQAPLQLALTAYSSQKADS
jgi:hypothetical protein